MNCIKCAAALPDGALYCCYCGKKQTATQKKGRKRANGEGSVYRDATGRWRAQIVVGYKLINGRSQSVKRTKAGFETKRAAIEYLEQLRGQPTKQAPTLQKLWEEYQAAGYTKLSASRQEKYRIAWPKLEPLHQTRIDLLTTADLQQAVNDGAKTYYPARDMRDLLSLLYQIAIANQYVPVNLAEYIILPELNAKDQQAFTQEEVLKLWKHYTAGEWWTGYILLMCYTGMMPGELMEAKKEQVDLQSHTITGAGKKTKTRKEKPIVLADEIVPVVQSLMEHTKGEKLLRINKDRFYDRYYEILAAAGVPKLPPYSCRHTAATMLSDADIRPALVQSIMRHASYATTQRYVHENVTSALEAVNQLPKPTSKTEEPLHTVPNE